MAMIEGHDYVIITSWTCPYCHKFHGNLNTMIGRYPATSKLLCQGCTREMHYTAADNVSYKP